MTPLGMANSPLLPPGYCTNQVPAFLYRTPSALEYARHSRYACVRCGKAYELCVQADAGEFEALADPVPPHFDLLQEQINAEHPSHPAPRYLTDGVRVWEPDPLP